MINVGELKAIRAGPHGQWQILRHLEKCDIHSVKNIRRGLLNPAKEEAYLERKLR